MNRSQRFRNTSPRTSESMNSLGKRKRANGYLPRESSANQASQAQSRRKSRDSDVRQTLQSSRSCSQQSLISLVESQMDERKRRYSYRLPFPLQFSGDGKSPALRGRKA